MKIGRLFRSLRREPQAGSRRALANPQGDGFFCGANLPWIVYGCDFGANSWQPTGGMSLPRRIEALQGHFSALSDAGIRVVRWFMLCDGRAGLQFECDNVVLDSAFFPDVDTALNLAERFGIQILFTLFDFHWLYPAQFHRGVQAGGHVDFISNELLRKRLLENVVRPILTRYGSHSSVHSWDVFNEPEWILRGVGAWGLPTAIKPHVFRSFLKQVVHLIHDETAHPATLGLARRRSLDLFNDCSLDFHQLHWYDKQDKELWTPLQSRTPVLLGEFPTSGSRLSVAEILRHAHDAGFAGALGWPARTSAQLYDFPPLLAGLAEFRESAQRIG